MTRLQLHTCVLLASLSSARHWSDHKGLDRALFFRSHDFVHFAKLGQILLLRACHHCQWIHPQNWYCRFCELVEVVLSMDHVNWMLILTGEVVLVLEAECLKTFQVRFVVLHLCRLLHFGCGSLSLQSLWFVATLNGHSRDLVVPRLLTHYRYIQVHVQ